VQVDPIKPTLKAPGTKRFKLTHDKLLSSFAFNFDLRRYNMVVHSGGKAGGFKNRAEEDTFDADGVGQGLTLVHFSSST
jgi:hypothetical protein